MFAVVEFTKEKGVAVVPDCWLLNLNQDPLCFWPGRHEDATKLAQLKTPPSYRKWSVYPIRLLKTYNTYEEALQNLDNACITSNLDSDDDSRERRQRIRSKPARFVSSEGTDAEDEEENLATSPERFQRKKRKLHTVPVSMYASPGHHTPATTSQTSTPKPFPTAPASMYASPGHHTPATTSQTSTPKPFPTVPASMCASPGHHSPATPSQTSTPKPLPTVSEVDSESFLLKLSMKVDTLIEQQAETQLLLKRVLHAVVPHDPCEDVLGKQWDTEEALGEACEKLDVDKAYQKAMIRNLACEVVPTDAGDTARRMLRKLMTNRLMARFSLKGKSRNKENPKIRFDDLPIYKIITKAVLRSSVNFSLKEFEAKVAETLVLAPHRDVKKIKFLDQLRSPMNSHQLPTPSQDQSSRVDGLEQ